MLKPFIDVALVGPNGQQLPQQRALVDSGCDFSNFPAAWAAPLGIDFANDCEPIKSNTASGEHNTARIYRDGVHGLVCGHRVKLYAVFSPLLPIALLGREDFMHYFKVSFDQRQQSFTLEPH